MKIQEKDEYHGPALMQIVEHPSFKAINKTDKKYGHYTLNTNRHLFVKYRTRKNSPWQFSFGQDEMAGRGDFPLEFPVSALNLECSVLGIASAGRDLCHAAAGVSGVCYKSRLFARRSAPSRRNPRGQR